MNLAEIGYDSFILTPALGVGFWDNLTDRLVDTGLEVSMQPRHLTEKPVKSITNRRGIHVFPKLPGINPLNNDLESPHVMRQFTFNVRDLERRFIPFSFDADCPFDGLYLPGCIHESPPGNNYIPVFNATTRKVNGGVAVVRADLHNVVTDQPASWAMVTGEIDGQDIVRGIADSDGKLILIFSYPEPQIITSPPSTVPGWILKLRVFYSPIQPVPDSPSLCSVLSQTQSKFVTSNSISADELNVDLEFKQEKTLRSGSMSHLLIEPM